MKYNRKDKIKNKKLLDYYVIAVEKLGNVTTISKKSKIAVNTLEKIAKDESTTLRTFQKLEIFF
ncbi:hypothetical protein [Silvanigrella sp.]|jgi:hypothetical protein|uniref:hypothetical protein n=1 Tax=Silvanigrella sp. TaxID=2024976 RepID=UPI0037C96F17|nr:hypothetical protein [Silvanigrellaceae bacterium]